MKRLGFLAIALAAAACGTPPNHRLLTRTSDYMKAMSFGFSTGFPFDIGELERRYPELKGIVVTAPQWIAEYEHLVKEAERKGTSVFDYRIGPGSQIGIEVTGEPGLSKTYAVPPTGYVHFPYLGKIKLSGLTPDELQKSLESQLAVYLKKPEVLIHLLQAPNQGASLLHNLAPTPTFGSGEILVFGLAQSRVMSNIAFTGKETMVSLLGMIGLPASAEWRQIRVIRRNFKDPFGKARIILCDMWDYFAKADMRQDIPLFPGDVVFVPMRWSTEEQFWEDWGYAKKILSEVFFVDSLKDVFKKGGTLRD